MHMRNFNCRTTHACAANALLTAGVNRPHGAGRANPGHSRMQITTALVQAALSPRLRLDPWDPRTRLCALRRPSQPAT